jgi:hypothetical protein
MADRPQSPGTTLTPRRRRSPKPKGKTTMPDILIPNIRFVDIKARETLARQQVRIDYEKLEARKKKTGGLSAPDELELQRLKGLIDAKGGKYLDPLFTATRAALAEQENGLLTLQIEHKDGLLEFPVLRPDGAARDEAAWDAQVARISLVLGLLQLRQAPLPPLVAAGGEVRPASDHRNAPLFVEAFYRAIGRAAGSLELAKRALKLIADAVDLRGDRQEPQVSSLEYAKVVERLIESGVQASDPNLKRRVDELLDRVQETGDDKPAHEIGINLPDLEATTDYQVVEDNIRLMGPMIFASMFDELKAFQVVDKLIEMSQRGELSLIRGKAGTQLYHYWRQAPNRMSEMERQTFYAMTLGIPTGQPGISVNRDFQDLWIRFVSSVSSLVRENRVDQILRSQLPVAINQQQVKKSARDLASNMSLYGYGMAYYAAIDLQTQINEMIELLQDTELRAAFGARDMWGVIDQVAQLELGGARNSSKYRTLATCGAIITAWLANNTDRLRDPTRPMIELRDVENPPARPSGQTATSHPTDYDLVNACELWLADSAMTEDRVEELAQPRESPQQPSRPIQIPSVARDLLEGAGLGFEMGAGLNGSGRTNGRAPASYPGY